MAAINIPDIYGRHYLVNFDNVKFIEVSDNEERGDLIITFMDKATQVISVGLDREGAGDMLVRLCQAVCATDLSVRSKALWR
ncbi:TPA: hypothetical protein I8Y21_006019 [Klebsiella oxytoca]|uniref:Uncharacterized protein n=1 Tax=Klebsiella oxytoca TaxID=571 RepID=A0AAN5LES3_KLEOX|nr:hypothetical protein [Klebsiella oxytoca]